ncbi:MAG TPA: hypothetical protein VFZ38_08140 [Vicinamibacterales bacterium]|jgi:hypothetical protein
MRAAVAAPASSRTARRRPPLRRPPAPDGMVAPIGVWRYIWSGSVASLLTAPVIYSVLVPFAVLDVWVMLFQAICFRAWGLRPVRRGDYFVIDRHRLPYLNGLEKINCLFCSYANGLLAYVHEVASRTEQFWCPIRHGRRVRGAHHRYAAFAPYGDARAFRDRLPFYRAGLKRYTLHS